MPCSVVGTRAIPHLRRREPRRSLIRLIKRNPALERASCEPSRRWLLHLERGGQEEGPGRDPLLAYHEKITNDNHSTGVRAGPFPRRRGRARSTWRVEGAGLRVRDAVWCKVREHRMQETDVPSRVLIWDIRIYFRRTRASSRASAAHPRPRSPRSRGRWKQRICSAVAAQQCPAGTHRTGHPARSEPAAPRQLTEPCRGRWRGGAPSRRPDRATKLPARAQRRPRAVSDPKAATPAGQRLQRHSTR